MACDLALLPLPAYREGLITCWGLAAPSLRASVLTRR